MTSWMVSSSLACKTRCLFFPQKEDEMRINLRWAHSPKKLSRVQILCGVCIAGFSVRLHSWLQRRSVFSLNYLDSHACITGGLKVFFSCPNQALQMHCKNKNKTKYKEKTFLNSIRFGTKLRGVNDILFLRIRTFSKLHSVQMVCTDFVNIY